ncbi:MAG TPA: hypothetical protein VK932_12220 [Kofleriaceae bacterium]|nr:hypothetical protein [Kofleriaceae bacterium]
MAELTLRDPRRALDQVERRGIAQSILEDADRTGKKIRDVRIETGGVEVVGDRA